ncbi:MAG: HAD-IA family hydrolase [Anaerolineaceae bacterium]|nr:HAD-IA family hydrolase [Anaerolineaceae bacterium]
MIRALIFDFDGLILDTETPEFQSWQAIYQSYGCDMPLSLWTTMIGRGNDDITFDPYGYLESQIKRSIDRDVVRAARRARMMEMIALQPVLPGITNYLADGKQMGLKIGLASSSSSEWVKGHLSRVGLIEHFECIRTADDVIRTKPDPELYLAVLKEMDIQPQEVIAFEDSANGAWAAKRAGLFCVAVPNPMTSSLNFDHVDYRLNSLADMGLSELIQVICDRSHIT